MSQHKYIVSTVSTGGIDASIQVECYIDDVLDSTVPMLYTDYRNTWRNFDDLIQIRYNTSSFNWEVEILGDVIDYEVGDTVSWNFGTTVEYTFTEVAPTPPPPPPTGGFTIELMNNTEELNKISKNPTLVRSLSGYLREETDIVDPEILIEFDGTLTDCNYMHIPILNRYYFITKITSVRTKLWRVSAHCDVLKTYAEGILNTQCVVARSESRYNLFLNDSMFKVYANPRLQIAKFPNKFTGESYILVMNGAQYL